MNSPQWKAFGCFYERSNIEKSFLNFPNPKSYAKDRKTCQKWLDNSKNGSLPRKIDKYLWKRADLVCEDHFAPGNFDPINGAFVNDHWSSNLKLWSYCACSSFSRLTQWRCRANTGHIYTRCPAESTCDGFRFPLFSHSQSQKPAATLLPFTLAPSCRTLNQNLFYIRSDYLVLCIKTHTKRRHSLPPSSRLLNLDFEQTWP